MSVCLDVWICVRALVFSQLSASPVGLWNSRVGGLDDQGQGHWLCVCNFPAEARPSVAMVMGLSNLSQSAGLMVQRSTRGRSYHLEFLKLEEALCKSVVYLSTGVICLPPRLDKSNVGRVAEVIEYMWTNGSNEQKKWFSKESGHVQEGNALEGGKWQKTLD